MIIGTKSDETTNEDTIEYLNGLMESNECVKYFFQTSAQKYTEIRLLRNTIIKEANTIQRLAEIQQNQNGISTKSMPPQESPVYPLITEFIMLAEHPATLAVIAAEAAAAAAALITCKAVGVLSLAAFGLAFGAISFGVGAAVIGATILGVAAIGFFTSSKNMLNERGYGNNNNKNNNNNQ